MSSYGGVANDGPVAHSAYQDARDATDELAGPTSPQFSRRRAGMVALYTSLAGMALVAAGMTRGGADDAAASQSYIAEPRPQEAVTSSNIINRTIYLQDNTEVLEAILAASGYDSLDALEANSDMFSSMVPKKIEIVGDTDLINPDGGT